MDNNLCDCGSDLICVVRRVDREKRREKNNFMVVGKVVRQSRMKGVLITSGLGITKWRREIAQTERFC